MANGSKSPESRSCIVLRVCIAGWNSTESDLAYAMLRGRPDLTLPEIRPTGASVVTTLREGHVDAVLFPTDWIDVARAIKQQVFPALAVSPSVVLVTDRPRLATRARALSCGFDGAVDVSSAADDLVMDLNRITSASQRLENDADLQSLGIVPGLLARGLVLNDDDDASLADLIASGASDDAIAEAMGWSTQLLRNRIARLLETNGMSYRTQLAVARASSVRIPDFVRLLSE